MYYLWILLIIACPYSAAFRITKWWPTQQSLVQAGVQLPLIETAIRPKEDEVRWESTLLSVLQTMQDRYFCSEQGTWPEAIDWTAAVLNTHLGNSCAMLLQLSTVHETSQQIMNNTFTDFEQVNILNRYFTQALAFFYGEDSFSLRFQAYDDMLWVVLAWLEQVRFIKLYSRQRRDAGLSDWYGEQFVPQFAERARLFYDIAAQGWDETLCGGGMVWSPHEEPYKNSITNQLFITASMMMHLHYPLTHIDDAKSKEKYLARAIRGHDWLHASDMLNVQGLYGDGFHITGWKRGSNGTGQCDKPNRKVYTYNQGVILTGLKGLWETTSEDRYLEEGHTLISNVINATGWPARKGPDAWRWAGLGRNGTMEDSCDWNGSCNQNGQTFKGIFFHHLTAFCESTSALEQTSLSAAVRSHRAKCSSYKAWVNHNAAAAAMTRDRSGRIGSWWGRAPTVKGSEDLPLKARLADEDIEEVDSRNVRSPQVRRSRAGVDESRHGQLERHKSSHLLGQAGFMAEDRDLNDRGRGRSVETQSGGLAVIKAAWAFNRLST